MGLVKSKQAFENYTYVYGNVFCNKYMIRILYYQFIISCFIVLYMESLGTMTCFINVKIIFTCFTLYKNYNVIYKGL